MLTITLKLVISYLLGSLNGSLVLGRFRGIDIRNEGSGNAGGTNALRTHGRLFALGVIVIDVRKSVLATGWVAGAGLLGEAATGVSATWITLACGAAAVVGHCWPVLYGFRGGKGMATLLGVYLVIAPALILIMLMVWLVTVGFTGYVGLATILGAAAVPLWMIASGVPLTAPLAVFGIAMALMIVFTHRSNIARMKSGEEARFSWSWLARR